MEEVLTHFGRYFCEVVESIFVRLYVLCEYEVGSGQNGE
jgi:hypothetical protein